MTTTHDIRQAVHQTMPAAIENLKQLVRIPSIATQGYTREQVLEAARTTEAQVKAAGFQQVHQLEELAGGYPAVYGEIPGPPGTPTVLLYAHYDVCSPAWLSMGYALVASSSRWLRAWFDAQLGGYRALWSCFIPLMLAMNYDVVRCSCFHAASVSLYFTNRG